MAVIKFISLVQSVVFSIFDTKRNFYALQSVLDFVLLLPETFAIIEYSNHTKCFIIAWFYYPKFTFQNHCLITEPIVYSQPIRWNRETIIFDESNQKDRSVTQNDIQLQLLNEPIQATSLLLPTFFFFPLNMTGKTSPLDILQNKKRINVCAPMVRYSKLPFRELVRK